MTTRGIDEMLEMAFDDLDKGENKAAATAFIKYYIKYLKKKYKISL